MPLRVLLRKQIERNGFTLGDLAHTAALATAQAHRKALKTNVKIITAENGYLYESVGNGPKVKIREVKKYPRTIPSKFQLK